MGRKLSTAQSVVHTKNMVLVTGIKNIFVNFRKISHIGLILSDFFSILPSIERYNTKIV